MIGESIGHFKIVSHLGRGGMGEVYLAEHETMQTRVAIKMLLADISRDTQHVSRFFKEAIIVGKIKHAGIVKIFDSGVFHDRAYLVMELLEGEPLADRIEHGRIPPQQAAELARQIASVLDATHRAGVIHRDLKPDNIFLVPDHELASGERVKVLDFGISKLSGTMAGDSPKTVGTMGTPAYMAPEQWGDAATVDWRADAYSLGCVLFEMASGRPPFVTSTIFEACGKHMNATPPRVREFVPNAPVELDDLIARLLAKDPADRAVSMAQIVRELDAIAGVLDRPRASSQPSASGISIDVLPAAPRPTLTTLGGSALEVEAPVSRRRPALIGGLVAGLGVVAVVVFVLVGPKGGHEPAPATPPSAETPVAPVLDTGEPDATAIVSAPAIDAAAVAITADAGVLRDASVIATAHHHPVIHTAPPPDARPVIPPVVVTPPPPPHTGSDVGGRI